MRSLIATLLLVALSGTHPLTFLAIGDSKTTGECGLLCWQHTGYEKPLESLIGAHEIQPRLGHDGATLADLVRALPEDLSVVSQAPDVILLDIGTNDMQRRLGEAFYWHWRWDLLTYLKTWHKRFPDAIIYVAFPRNYAPYTDADFAPMDSAITDTVAQLPYGRPGIHESDYLRNNSADGVHPTPVGYELEAKFWKNVLQDW